MAAPAAVLAAKAAILAATDKRTWTAAASVIAAVLAPFILIIIMVLCPVSYTHLASPVRKPLRLPPLTLERLPAISAQAMMPMQHLSLIHI